jgi:hypothetical protein
MDVQWMGAPWEESATHNLNFSISTIRAAAAI